MHPAYEQVFMTKESVPVNIQKRQNNSSASGCQFHWHEQLEFYVVEQGGVNLFCNGRQSWIYPGEVGVVNWCEPHRSTGFLDNTVHYIVQVDLFLLLEKEGEEGQYLLRKIREPLPLVLSQELFFENAFHRMIRQKESQLPGWQMAVKGEAMCILAKLFQLSKNGTVPEPGAGSPKVLDQVKRILSYLHQKETEAISLAEMARELGMSESHMCRIFKVCTGTTILHYVHQLRCTRAAALLRGGKTVAEASLATGYCDYNYFSRIFKKVMGCPPSKYE